MRTKNFNLLFKIAIFLVVMCALTTCNVSHKATSSNSFKIPKKIIKAEDLPKPVREKEEQVYYVQLFPDEVTKEANTGVPVSKPIETALPETAKNESAREAVVLANNTKEIEKQVNEVVKNLMQPNEKPMYYHIVSGSFHSKENADKFASHLKSIGYGNTYVTFFDNGFNRVIVQRYTNEVEARQYLMGYRADNPKYADAWLFYNENYNERPLAFLTR